MDSSFVIRRQRQKEGQSVRREQRQREGQKQEKRQHNVKTR